MRNFESLPKKESGISDVFGASPEEENNIITELKEKFSHSGFHEEIKQIEKSKTPEEVEIIENINNYLPEFLKDYDGIPLSVKPENIFFIDEEKLNPEEKKQYTMAHPTARSYPLEQIIVFFPPYPDNYPKIKSEMARMIAHEIFHLNSYTSLKKTDKGVRLRQMGLSIEPAENKKFLANVAEAIIEELAISFADKYFKCIPCLQEEALAREDFILSRPKEEQEEARKEIAYVWTGRFKKGYETIIGGFQSYEKERKSLQEIINKIYSENKNKFTAPEEIFNVFAKMVFSGNFRDLAKLIEDNLGKGAFKEFVQNPEN